MINKRIELTFGLYVIFIIWPHCNTIYLDRRRLTQEEKRHPRESDFERTKTQLALFKSMHNGRND